MKIISYNLLKLKDRKHHLEELLRNETPDVICMQETYHPVEYMNHRFFRVAGYNDLTHVPPLEKKGEGIGTFTRDSVSSCSMMNSLPEYLSKYRNAVYNVIEVSGEEFHLVNLHAPWKYYLEFYGYNHKERWYESLLTLIDSIKEVSSNIILIGDFNVCTDMNSPDSPDESIDEGMIGWRPFEHSLIQKILDKGFMDAFKTLHQDSPGYTWKDPHGSCSSKTGKQRIDYALVSSSLSERLVQCHPLSEYREKSDSSDHIPLLLEIV